MIHGPCFRYDDKFSGDASYRTTVDWAGCWEATNDETGPAPSRSELSGCVTLFDHWRPVGRLLD